MTTGSFTMLDTQAEWMNDRLGRFEYKQELSTTLEKFCQLLNLNEVPTDFEVYLGTNWKEVIRFWKYLDGLTEQQVEGVFRSYSNSSHVSRQQMQQASYFMTYDPMKVYRSPAGDAARFKGFEVAAMATYELIGNHKSRYALPLFVGFS